jgi:hypothetical protein
VVWPIHSKRLRKYEPFVKYNQTASKLILKEIFVTKIHNHGSPFNMSAVYYVSVPQNSGKFVFQFKINDSIDNRMFINPIESYYILFPSSINHFVTRNNSDDLRISLSFNFLNYE